MLTSITLNSRHGRSIVTERSANIGKPREGHLDVCTRAVGIRVDQYSAADGGVVAVRQLGHVLGANWVAGDDLGIAGQCCGGERGQKADGRFQGAHRCRGDEVYCAS